MGLEFNQDMPRNRQPHIKLIDNAINWDRKHHIWIITPPGCAPEALDSTLNVPRFRV